MPNGFIIKRRVKSVLPYKGAATKEKKLVSFTVLPDGDASWAQRRFFEKLADALDTAFTQLIITPGSRKVTTRREF